MGGSWAQWRQYVFPQTAEDEPAFQREILRLSHSGLRVIGGVQIAVSIFMTMARFIVSPDPNTLGLRLAEGASMVLLGLLNVALSQSDWARKRARNVAIATAFAGTVILTLFSLVMAADYPRAEDFIPGQLTAVLLILVAAIPLLPVQTFLFGVAACTQYYVAASVCGVMLSPLIHPQQTHLLFIIMLTLLATALAALNYRQRITNFRYTQEKLRSADNLRVAQSRVLLSENAATMGRLAAAISHELNSPIGALVSAVDTLLLLAGRQATSDQKDQQRMVVLQAELRKTIKESAKRLQDIAGRMQRFTNLDKAEVQEANLNELLSDVAALIDPKMKGETELEFNLHPLPPLVCRPQQLSAAFANLLGNALEAAKAPNGANGARGRVCISTAHRERSLEVTIADNGPGVPPEELRTIFDPGFKVRQGRVGTGNWSMFSSRQMIQEQGGQIALESQPGQGTTVRVTLPVSGIARLT